jgi:uncharacterized membrane protein
MEHASYALFDDEEKARAASETIEAAGDPDHPGHHCAVVVHRGQLHEGELKVIETGASEGLREGAVVGGVLGAIAGAFAFGPIGLGGGAALGILYGGVAGALGGSGAPDRRLENLSKELAAGKILVVVAAPDFACRDGADAILKANGGRVRHKPFF